MSDVMRKNKDVVYAILILPEVAEKNCYKTNVRRWWNH
jgi:hypothetical protein